jgi:hypothetical protein
MKDSRTGYRSVDPRSVDVPFGFRAFIRYCPTVCRTSADSWRRENFSSYSLTKSEILTRYTNRPTRVRSNITRPHHDFSDS